MSYCTNSTHIKRAYQVQCNTNGKEIFTAIDNTKEILFKKSFLINNSKLKDDLFVIPNT